MRRRKTDLAARVNGNLAFEFDDITLTSYAGLELFAQYLRPHRLHSVGPPRVRGRSHVGRLRGGRDGPGGDRTGGGGRPPPAPCGLRRRRPGGPALRGRASDADRPNPESLVDALYNADRPALAGAQCGRGHAGVVWVGPAHVASRRYRMSFRYASHFNSPGKTVE